MALEQQFEEHLRDYRDFKTDIAKDVRDIKENHLAHIQSEMTEMRTDMAKVSTDTSWLVRFFWVIATAAIGGLMTGLLNLLVTQNGT